MKLVMKSAYGGKTIEYPINNLEDLAEFLQEFPSATHAAVSLGKGNLEQMATLAAKYLSSHHMDVKLVKD
jgi:hypothetical protein